MTSISNEDVIKLARRVHYLTRELEAESLDLHGCSKAYANGSFPKSDIVKTLNRFTSYATELRRIEQAFAELFAEQLNAEEVVKVVPIKKRGRPKKV